jgi:hypothetical protein
MSETIAPSRPAPLPVMEVTDSLGRKLRIQKLDILKELDLIEGAGKASTNDRWMMFATLAACVTAIDGVPCIAPSTRELIRAQVQRVGGEGIAAVADALNETIPNEAAPGSADDTDTAKN